VVVVLVVMEHLAAEAEEEQVELVNLQVQYH
jgi:hypothetical protein